MNKIHEFKSRENTTVVLFDCLPLGFHEKNQLIFFVKIGQKCIFITFTEIFEFIIHWFQYHCTSSMFIPFMLPKIVFICISSYISPMQSQIRQNWFNVIRVEGFGMVTIQGSNLSIFGGPNSMHSPIFTICKINQ